MRRRTSLEEEHGRLPVQLGAIRGNQRRTSLEEEHGRLPVPLLRVFVKRRVAEIGLCERQVWLHRMPSDRSLEAVGRLDLRHRRKVDRVFAEGDRPRARVERCVERHVVLIGERDPFT